jgi:hypothetical protein
MTAHDTKQTAVDVFTDEPKPGDQMQALESSRLRIATTGDPRISKPRHRFPKGNKLGGRPRRDPTADPLEVLDKILTDVLLRVIQREYEVIELPDGRRRRMLKPLEPNAVNSLANLARVKIDLASQREAFVELRRLQGELDRMRTTVVKLLKERRGVL